MAEPPPGFTDIKTALDTRVGTFINVIGVVVDKREPVRSRGTDFLFSISIHDGKSRDSLIGGNGMQVRFFKPRMEDLPQVNNIGDIVLLRQVKVIEYGGTTLLLSAFATTFLVFPAAKIPQPEWSITYMGGKSIMPCLGDPAVKERLSIREQEYVIALNKSLSDLVSGIKANAAPPASPKRPREVASFGDSYRPPYSAHLPKRPPPAFDANFDRRKIPRAGISRKFHLIKDTGHLMFADICVEVIKKYPTHYQNCDLYVTDYTEHPSLYYYAPPEEEEPGRDGDDYGYTSGRKKDWPGPYGQLVMKVVLSEPHAQYATQLVDVGDIVLLQNVKVKQDQMGRLQGDMWRDMTFHDKILVKRHPSDTYEEVQQLRERKEKYWSTRAAKVKPAEQATTMSRGERKKNRKRQQRENERTARLAELEKTLRANQHVRCSHEDQPLSTIRKIRDEASERHTNRLPDGTSYSLPFINATFRAKVKVVDFYPPSIEDFAQRSENTSNTSDSPIDYSPYSSPAWTWSFSLLVQDVTNPMHTDEDRIWLNQGHEQMQYLLGNDMPDPADLRSEPSLLARLKEKLCILWGDLEEQKTAGKKLEPSNRPFECCISEYGALKDSGRMDDIADWERQYMLHGVTIL